MNELLGFLTDNCCGGAPCCPASRRCAAPTKTKATTWEDRS